MRLRAALLIALSTAAGLGVAELCCRAAGLPFPKYVSKVMAETPPIFQADPVLGWRLQPGRYQIFDGKQVTILADGSRDVGTPAGAPLDVLALGCSYTMGWGLADGDDYVSRLRAAHPARGFRNFGTAGYGAYQSLLLLEEELRKPEKPKLVLYGLIAHHEARSFGDPSWAMMIESMPIHGRTAHAPYATLPRGEPAASLQRHGPLVLPDWPLERSSNLVGLARLDWLRFRAGNPQGMARAVTEEAIAEMRDDAQRAGARFAVVILDLYGEAHEAYLASFQARGIDYVDCADPDFLKPELRLADHIHPNAAMHARYAACVSRWLDARTPL